MRFLVIFFLLTLFSFSGYTQICPCEPKSELNICYLSREKVCSDFGALDWWSCGMTFDNEYIVNGLVQKLSNKDLFGLDGVINCEISYTPFLDINNSDQLVQEECDMFFVGNFPADSMDVWYNPEFTLIDSQALNAIYEWSVICSQNLVMVAEEDADRWGYVIENKNENPNYPVDNGSEFFSIFDGPFGKIDSFNQIGGYRGIITQSPLSGHTVLGIDRNGLPILVLDHLTNDIIYCDANLFTCVNNYPVTVGDQITTDTDRLACNIFALACQLSDEAIWKHEVYNICKGDQIVSSTGEILELEGNYLDTLFIANACDTIINSQLIFSENEGFYSEERCLGDGYSLNVGNMVIDENNPTGEVIIPNSLGCDSTITVNLDFQANSAFLISEDHCENSSYSLEINNTLYDINNPTGEEIIMNSIGCDSIITIDLRYDQPISSSNVILDFCIESNDIQFVDGTPFTWQSADLEIIRTNSLGCDSIIYVDVNVLEHSESDFYPLICESDNTSFTINGTDYSIDNPQGQEIITNAAGCDSIINVFIEVLFNSYSEIEESLCQNSTDFFQIGNSIYDVNNLSGTETITNVNGCDSVIAVNITIIDSELPDIDTILFVTESDNVLNLGLSDAFHVQWIQSEGLSCTDCYEPSYNIDLGLESYDIVVSDINGCTSEYTIEIFKVKPPYIPNAFSPNGDGINDAFEIFFEPRLLSSGISITSFLVFDRWGNVIVDKENLPFTNQLELWDGRTNEKPLLPGVYVYHLAIQYGNDQVMHFQGDLSLIR